MVDTPGDLTPCLATRLKLSMPSAPPPVHDASEAAFLAAVESRTGMTAHQIRQTPLDQIRRRTERRFGWRMAIRSFWPLIGRGNIMHGRTQSREEVDAALDEALR